LIVRITLLFLPVRKEAARTPYLVGFTDIALPST
jgi:hypothetical protein